MQGKTKYIKNNSNCFKYNSEPNNKYRKFSNDYVSFNSNQFKLHPNHLNAHPHHFQVINCHRRHSRNNGYDRSSQSSRRIEHTWPIRH